MSRSYTESALFRILNPQSVCFMGASNRINSMGTMALLNTLGSGYRGKVYVVHPKDRTVQGFSAYSSIAALPEAPDLLILVVPTVVVPQVLAEAGKRGTRRAVVITAGYNEVDEAGKELQKQIDEVVEEYRIRYLGPNCLGFVNRSHCINTTTIPFDGRSGGIAFASHSGSYVCQALPYAEEMDLGIAEWISLGNEGNLDVVDSLDYFRRHPGVRVVGLYLEGIRRPEAFRKAALRLAASKPVVALYSGGTREGARSAASHTGAVSTPGAVMAGFLRQCGILQAETSLQLLQWLNAFERQPLPKGPRVAILTNSGGPGTSMADQVGKSELVLASFSGEVKERLSKTLPRTGSASNPVDLSFASDLSVYGEKLPRILAQADEVDAIMVYGLAVYASELWKRMGRRAMKEIPLETEEMVTDMLSAQADTMIQALTSSGKPVIAANLDARMDPGVRRVMVQGNIPVYTAPEESVRAMEALWRYTRIRERIEDHRA